MSKTPYRLGARAVPRMRRILEMDIYEIYGQLPNAKMRKLIDDVIAELRLNPDDDNELSKIRDTLIQFYDDAIRHLCDHVDDIAPITVTKAEE